MESTFCDACSNSLCPYIYKELVFLQGYIDWELVMHNYYNDLGTIQNHHGVPYEMV